MAALAAMMSKIEEASKKKDEQTSAFIVQTKEALDQKMDTHVEKREAYINDLKAKLKDHVRTVGFVGNIIAVDPECVTYV